MLHGGILIKDGKWQPWNQEITVVLRRILNPIPMYASKVETQIPVLGKEIGFDLIVRDWMAPYGRGEREDFRIIVSRQVDNIDSYEGSLSIVYDGAYCGVQIDNDVATNSGYRSSRLAPSDGYAQS